MDLNVHRRQYGNLAENYSKHRKDYNNKVFELFFSLLPKNNKKILDIACGTGKSTVPLVRQDTEVYGCDHDEAMIYEAVMQSKAQNKNIQYRVAEAEKLPYEDEYFDAVTVGTAFHWFASQKSILEIRRVLRKNGLLFIFWSMPADKRVTNDSVPIQIPASILNKYNWDLIPSQLKTTEFVGDILRENKFFDIHTAKVSFMHKYTKDELVGRLKTASSYGLLSEKNKEKFINEVSEYLAHQMSGALDATEEIHVCYCFKK